MEINDKKVLLVGLGILGGGIATAKWLVDNGAILTITDLKDSAYLRSSLSKLKNLNIRYVLGRHKEDDFINADLVVLNPDVPVDSQFVKIAKRNKVPITNELNLFTEFCKSKKQISVTGTRGKTTSVNWIGYLLNELAGKTLITGNSPTAPFLKVVNKIREKNFVVAEVPSYHLEIINKGFKPKVSVITNIYRDHINRHKTEENYAKIKTNIFKNQNKDDYLILNFDNKWTKEILKKKIKPNLFLFSIKKLPLKFENGSYLNTNGDVVVRKNNVESVVLNSRDFPKFFGEHNKTNLMIGIIVLGIFNIDTSKVKGLVNTLPQVPMREEKIYEDKNLTVINDSAATSPEATIAAVKRFIGTKLVLITGGTDKGLEYKALGKFLNNNVSDKNLVLLAGSATDKLKKSLINKKPNEFDSLEDCVDYANKIKGKKTVVFSPGAKSFEKFKNEFDRGEKFNFFIRGKFKI